MAFCKAVSQRIGLQLYEYIGMIYWEKEYQESNFKLPKPQILMLEGGKHGNWSTDIQEYMVVPKEGIFPNIKESIRAGSEIFHTIHDILDKKGYSVGVGYEGAYSPKELTSNREALDIIMEGIKKAGYEDRFDLALDIASSEFFNPQTLKYDLKRENSSLTSSEWLDLQKEWYSEYPIYSIEDPMEQNSWKDWNIFTNKLGSRYQVVGDDL